MKDYGNAGALCGALGCMVLLLVSMHFAKVEDKPDTEKVSAEVIYDDSSSKVTTSAVSGIGTDLFAGTSVSSLETLESMSSTDISSVSEPDITTATDAAIEPGISISFIGPLTKQQRDTLEASISYPPEVRHLAYPQQLSIVGDSIASGFGVYGVLNNSYDFATGNLGARSIDDYAFSYGGEMGKYLDVLTASQPAYIYLSMGMNDVNIVTSDQYADDYKAIITNVHEICPDSIIIVAGITPVSAESTFAANSTIVMFNEKLKAAVESFASPMIRYYDAGSYIKDEATGALRSDCDGGDGIHLSSSAYYSLLENLYPLLDEMPLPKIIKDIIEEQDLASKVAEMQEDENNDDSLDDGYSEEPVSAYIE